MSQRWSAVPDALCWTKGILGQRKQEVLRHLSTACITAAFRAAPPETIITLCRGSENTFISAASRSAFLLILQQGFAVGWGRLLPTQMTVASWKLRPELHWLFLEPTAQISLLPFSILSTAQLLLLNRVTTICCRRKY